MKRDRLPSPSVAFSHRVNEMITSPLRVDLSGEVIASIVTGNLGAVIDPSRIADVWLSVGASGKDDAQDLDISGEVYINNVTALSTRPTIAHVSGEASQQKTTRVTGDTGIIQAVVDTDANTANPGDSITYDLTLVRTATPTTEISSVSLVVELEPLNPYR